MFQLGSNSFAPKRALIIFYEEFHGWTENPGSPEGILNRDEMLDNTMLYWLPNAGASAARLY